MTLFEIAALLLFLSALFGYINHVWLKLPHTIGLVVMALAASLMVVLADLAWPSLHIARQTAEALRQVNFADTLMKGMLALLLFAGAVHVDFSELAARKWAIGLMATLGVLVSTFVAATGIYWFGQFFCPRMPFVWALVFGALIAPTDPVAVMGILRTVRIPRLLRAKITGESLFNDGVGVVVFTVILAIAMSVDPGFLDPAADTTHGAGGAAGHGADVSLAGILRLFVLEAAGGALLGGVAGWIAYLAMRRINEYVLEVLITLALVFATYAVALRLHLSGPIAMVVAGLLIGNHGARFAMSETTRQHVFQFWTLLDEILNSVLFLLIGLEVLIISWNTVNLPLAIFAIPAVLLARLVSVAIPIRLLSIRQKFEEGTIAVLTWGGLRGGISVALALSLPDNVYKPAILTATYAVVVFSIIVQGLTIRRLIARYDFRGAEQEPDPRHG
jgi:CPA1 family monovalent cation:H+ antiporter